MPDPDRHVHVVIANLTWDDVEQKWKAVKFRPIMDIRKYFDRCFDTILAGKLAELGYEIDTKWKANGRYHSWDIKSIPDAVITKNSRRSGEIEQVEQKILGKIEKENGHAPDQLSAVARDRLGATSRSEKRDDLTLEECRAYWKGRLTEQETAGIASAIDQARRGRNRKTEPGMAKAVDYAMRHEFHQRSVVPLGGAGHDRDGAKHRDRLAGRPAAGVPAAGRHHADEGRPAPVHHGSVATRRGRHHRLCGRRAGQGPARRPGHRPGPGIKEWEGFE